MTAEADGRRLVSSVQVELATLRVERSVLLADRERLAVQLAAVEDELRDTSAALAALVTQVDGDDTRRTSDEAARIAVTLAAVRRDRELTYEELRRTRRERDQLRIELLGLELAGRTTEESGLPHPGGPDDQGDVGSAALREQAVAMASHLEQELTAHQRTVSWRVTAPLRVVRRWQLRRRRAR